MWVACETLPGRVESRNQCAGLYERHGLPKDAARSRAENVMKNPETALGVMVRDELGIDSDQPSPPRAASSSAVLFCPRAIVPRLPFAITRGPHALWASLVASAVALFLLGAPVTRLTGRPPIRSGLRRVFFGLGAAAITYTIGLIVG